MSDDPAEVTRLLKRLRDGDRAAESELLGLVYRHLHGMAERLFRSERPGHTLQPTALISELYIRLFQDSAVDWQGRGHFYAVAAETIRRILIDHARAANAQRRPPPRQRISVDDVLIYSDDRAREVLLIDDALTRLAKWDARQAKIVAMRYFGGFSNQEIAESLDISERTVKRDWAMARAWLLATLNAA